MRWPQEFHSDWPPRRSRAHCDKPTGRQRVGSGAAAIGKRLASKQSSHLVSKREPTLKCTSFCFSALKTIATSLSLSVLYLHAVRYQGTPQSQQQSSINSTTTPTYLLDPLPLALQAPGCDLPRRSLPHLRLPISALNVSTISLNERNAATRGRTKPGRPALAAETAAPKRRDGV